ESNRFALGVNLLWIALLLDALSSLLSWLHIPGYGVVLPVIGLLIWWFLTQKIATGISWARVVYAVFALLEVAAAWLISQSPMASAVFRGGIDGLIAMAVLAARLVGIVLVFSQPAALRRA